MNAISQTSLLGDVAASNAGPDAALVALVQNHRRLTALYNAHDPVVAACVEADYEASVTAIRAAVPTTMAGVIAKARAAKIEAFAAGDGEHPDDGWAPDWAWDCIGDLIRVVDGDASLQVDPDAALTATVTSFLQAHRVWVETPQDDITKEDYYDSLYHNVRSLLATLLTQPALTRAGMQAKAEALRVCMLQDVPKMTTDTFAACAADHELLAMSLVLDLLGTGAAA